MEEMWHQVRTTSKIYHTRLRVTHSWMNLRQVEAPVEYRGASKVYLLYFVNPSYGFGTSITRLQTGERVFHRH
jgi:uncharacterized membrane protein YkvA (DUF1232 family)